MLFRILLTVFLLHCIAATDPLYTITAPNTVRPQASYEVVVTIHQAPSPVTVKAILQARSDANSKASMEQVINSGETKSLEIKTEDWNDESYTLNVTGTGGIEFSKSGFVNLKRKTFSVFVQTDKAIYQPNQIVQFRVIVVDQLLKPYTSKQFTIYIQDSQRNRIKQWDNVTFNDGIFSSELQLSDRPVMGDWFIKVENIPARNNVYEKQFTVAEYVLPTFEVKLHLPSYVTYNESDVVATVEAKYTYGKPLKGEVLLNVSDFYCQWPCVASFAPYVVKTSIDGTAEMKLNLVKDLSLPDHYRYGMRKFEFKVVVTEALTDRQMNTTGDLDMHQYKYKLEFINSDSFKPGLKYNTALKITTQDNNPVAQSDVPVTIQYGYSWGENMKSQEYQIPVTGLVEIELDPSDTADIIRLEAMYKGVKGYSSVSRAQSLSERYLQVSLLSENPKVGDEIELQLRATKPLNDPIIMQIVGRGNVLQVENFPGSKETSQTFKLKLTPEMAPQIRVICYYATPCGEVVADAIDLPIEGIFKTPVTVKVDPESTKPGSPVEVAVTTHPQAYVGLLAVDQSVLLLKKGNDISQNDVLNDLKEYEIGMQSSYPYLRYRRSIVRPWRPTSSTTMELFQNVGLLFFTNGLYYRIPQYTTYSFGGGYALRNHAPVAEVAFMAPPGAASGMAFDSTNFGEPARVREFFPETFLWTNLTTGADGVATVKTTAPDTITSYVINAFAIDSEHGLGLADSPAKLQIFRPFFVTLNLPYSVVRGETISLQVLVFNYGKEDIEAQVELDNEDGNFGVVSMENEIEETTDPSQLKKNVQVKSQDGVSVAFIVTPKKMGYLDIKINARSKNAADALIRKLLVKPEGVAVYGNKAVLIDLREQSNFQSKVDIPIPANIVEDSERIELSAIGDIMGTTINNLDKLLRMPYGCGEQNMLNFVPNIVITEYLTKTNQLNEEIRTKALTYMEKGYQGELSYKRWDGSFSAFGNRDKQGSTWLTAFVVKSFSRAKPFITIDDSVIQTALLWLSQQQTPEGHYPELGEVFHKAMQGGAGNGLALTAYTLTAFLESQANETLSKSMEKGIKLLENNLDNINSTYDLVLVTYALHLAKSDKKDAAFEKMNEKAIKEGDLQYWSVPVAKGNESDPMSYYNRPRSVDVELTSYAMLVYVHREQIVDAVPIMRWLVSKRNEYGGYESTQDTVLAIESLAKFAETLSTPDDSNVDVTVSYDSSQKTLSLNKNNALILQKEVIPKNIREVDVSATGKGIGIVQVSYSYNVPKSDNSTAFRINVKAASNKEDLTVKICAVYNEEGASNMAVMEIHFPSGYTADHEGLPKISREKKIKKVDTAEGDSQVVIYFDSINDHEVCISAKAFRAFKVAKLKPALVALYDYYDPVKRAEVLYDVPNTTICDICEDEECSKKCVRK